MFVYESKGEEINYNSSEELDEIFLKLVNTYLDSSELSRGYFVSMGMFNINQWLLLDLDSKINILNLYRNDCEFKYDNLESYFFNKYQELIVAERKEQEVKVKYMDSKIFNLFKDDSSGLIGNSTFSVEFLNYISLSDELKGDPKYINFKTGDKSFLRFLAFYTKSERVLKKLSRISDLLVKSFVFNNDYTDADTTSKLANQLKNKSIKYKILVANNEKTSRDILLELSESSNLYIRAAVARNPKLDSNIIEKLSMDSSIEVLSSVARNPSTPNAILKKLATEKSIVVRLHLSDNPCAGIDVLNILYECYENELDTHYSDKYGPYLFLVNSLSMHANCDEVLFEKTTVYDGKRVFVSPNIPYDKLIEGIDSCCGGDLFNSKNFKFISEAVEGLLFNIARLDKSYKAKILSIWDDEFKEVLSLNKELDVEIMFLLSQDVNPIVRLNVVNHKRCPLSIIENLLLDSDDRVRLSCLLKTNPDDVKDFFCFKDDNYISNSLGLSINSISSINDIFISYTKHLLRKEFFAQLLYASCSSLSPGKLKKFVKSKRWEERFSVARNSSLDNDNLEILVLDENKIVSDQAKLTLANGSQLKEVKENYLVNADSSLLKKLVDKLLVSCEENSLSQSVDYSEETLLELQSVCKTMPVWVLDTYELNESEINRYGNMIWGFPYTSKKHPWPISLEKKPLCPFLQLNLDYLKSATGQDFGTGILQIWLDISSWELDSKVRVIPKIDLADELSNNQYDYLDFDGCWNVNSMEFTLNYAGMMSKSWECGMFDWSLDRDELSSEEDEIIKSIESHATKNSDISDNYLLGFPDIGSGAPAGRHLELPSNFIQFKTSDVYSGADAGRLANIFYSLENEKIRFYFDY